MQALVSSQLTTQGVSCRPLAFSLCSSLSLLCPMNASCLALLSLSAPSQSREPTGLCLYFPGLAWTWKPFQGSRWAVHRAPLLCFPSFYPSLSDVSVLKIVVCILFISCCWCFRQERKSGPCVTPSWLEREVLAFQQF